MTKSDQVWTGIAAAVLTYEAVGMIKNEDWTLSVFARRVFRTEHLAGKIGFVVVNGYLTGHVVFGWPVNWKKSIDRSLDL